MRSNQGLIRAKGFTLIELMIVVAVLAVLSAIALPAYRNYVQTSREGVLVENITTMEVFQEDFRLRNGNYFAPAADIATINANIGWQPQNNNGTTYSIAVGPVVAGVTTYEVTATDPTGTSVCLRLPVDVRC